MEAWVFLEWGFSPGPNLEPHGGEAPSGPGPPLQGPGSTSSHGVSELQSSKNSHELTPASGLGLSAEGQARPS